MARICSFITARRFRPLWGSWAENSISSPDGLSSAVYAGGFGCSRYLYGLLSHYSLDSICHPFVNRASSGGSFSHTALESEFDRFLLTKDKVEKPHLRNLGKHLHLSDGECDTLRLFYPPATKGQIRESLRSMAAVTKLLGSSNPLLRGLTVHTLRATGESNAGLVMPEAPDARCAELDEPMLELYEQALGNYPEQAVQLQEHLLHQEPLGELFEPEFG